MNYREEGFLPEALFNYLCLLGWSPPDTEREIFSREELVKLFDLRDVNSAPAVFNRDKLRWMNGVYIREVVSLERLYRYALPFLKSAGYSVKDEDFVKKVLERTRDSYDTLKEMADRLRPFFVDEVDVPADMLSRLEDMRSVEILSAFMGRIDEADLSTPEGVRTFVRELQRELGVKPKEMWHTLRIALTGQLEGVGVDILLSTLPKERIKRRIERILRMIS